MSQSKSLVDTLFGEVFQTERSAARHCAIEAERLAGEPPAAPMRAVAEHAERAEVALHEHARRRGTQESALGKAVGTAFSVMRDDLADLMLTTEKSYRGTLLGMRHGVDLITLFAEAATSENDAALAAWARQWLRERSELIDACARELTWFARHPERALANSKAKA